MEQKKQLTGCALALGALMVVCGIFLRGFLRILALGVLYFVELDAVMTILYPKQPRLSKEEKIRAEDQWYFERQDPGKMYDMRRVGTVMNVSGAVLLVFGMIGGGKNPLWGVLGMGCALVCVALCIIQPAYFALIHGEKQKGREHHFPIVNLIFPYVFPLFGCALQFQYDRAIADWMRTAELMLLIGAVIGAALRLLAAECRRNTLHWIGGLFLACVCSFGFVMPLNGLLEKEEPVTVSGVVTDYNRGGRHSPSSYEVRLENGETVDIPINRYFFDEGDAVELAYHIGGLGIEYYTYAD